MQGISQVVEDLLASQEGLCSLEQLKLVLLTLHSSCFLYCYVYCVVVVVSISNIQMIFFEVHILVILLWYCILSLLQL